MGLLHTEIIRKSIQITCLGMALLIGGGFFFIEASATYLSDKLECKESCEEGHINCIVTCRDKFGTYYRVYPICMKACEKGQSSCQDECEIKIHL